MSDIAGSNHTPMMRMSDMAGSNHTPMPRSSSFPDMTSIVDGESWKAILEDEENFGPPTTMSMMSGASRTSGLMSGRISMMSIGSSASSGQWMNASLDGRSMLSEMSSDLNALDLAS